MPSLAEVTLSIYRAAEKYLTHQCVLLTLNVLFEFPGTHDVPGVTSSEP